MQKDNTKKPLLKNRSSNVVLVSKSRYLGLALDQSGFLESSNAYTKFFHKKTWLGATSIFLTSRFSNGGFASHYLNSRFCKLRPMGFLDSYDLVLAVTTSLKLQAKSRARLFAKLKNPESLPTKTLLDSKAVLIKT